MVGWVVGVVLGVVVGESAWGKVVGQLLWSPIGTMENQTKLMFLKRKNGVCQKSQNLLSMV